MILNGSMHEIIHIDLMSMMHFEDTFLKKSAKNRDHRTVQTSVILCQNQPNPLIVGNRPNGLAKPTHRCIITNFTKNAVKCRQTAEKPKLFGSCDLRVVLILLFPIKILEF